MWCENTSGEETTRQVSSKIRKSLCEVKRFLPEFSMQTPPGVGNSEVVSHGHRVFVAMLYRMLNNPSLTKLLGGAGERKKWHCNHCGRDGHTADRCFNNPQSKSYKGKKKAEPKVPGGDRNVAEAFADMNDRLLGAEDALRDAIEEREIENEHVKEARQPRTPSPPQEQEVSDFEELESTAKYFTKFIRRFTSGREGAKNKNVDRFSFDEGQKVVGKRFVPVNNWWNWFLRTFEVPVTRLDNFVSKWNAGWVFRRFNSLVCFHELEILDSDKYTIFLKHKPNTVPVDGRADVHQVIDFKHFERVCECQHFIYREFTAERKMEIMNDSNVNQVDTFMGSELATAELHVEEGKLELELFIQLTHVGLMDNVVNPDDARNAISRNAKRLCTINYNRYAHLHSNHLQAMSLHYAKAYFGYMILEKVSSLDFHRASPQRRDMLRLVIDQERSKSLLVRLMSNLASNFKRNATLLLVCLVLWRWCPLAHMLKDTVCHTLILRALLPSLMACVQEWGK